MNSKLNGSGGNGEDKQKKVVQFPTLADRDRMRKEKIAQEEAWRDEYKAKQKALKNSENPPFLNIGKIPLFVKVIAPLLLAIHIIMELSLSELQTMQTIQNFGLIPSSFWSNIGLQSLYTPFTHMFIHGGWMHLTLNTFMLVALGTFCAREFGNKTIVFLFFLCGLGGAFMHVLINFNANLPVIGASGAINGLFGILLIVIQRQGGFNQFRAVQKYGSLPIILFWLGFMVFTALLLGGQSWEAHIGGFLTGLLWLSWKANRHLKFWKL